MVLAAVKYGAKLRKRVAAVEGQRRAAHECPTCGKKRIKRVSTGIWECMSCGARFAGGAYVPKTDVGAAVARALGE